MLLMNQAPRGAQLKALVYGKTGTGKTQLGVTFPKPVFLQSEQQGFASVADAAQRTGLPMPPVLQVSRLDHVRCYLKALQSGSAEPIADALRLATAPLIAAKSVTDAELEAAIRLLPYARPESVVLDSVTDFARMIAEEIDLESPPRMAKDGLPQKSDRYWQVLRERCERMIRAFRDLPYHVLFLAELDDREIGEGDEKSREVRPAMPMNALPRALEHAVNVVGIAHFTVKTEVKDGTPHYEREWGVRFAAPGWMHSKVMRPLDDVEPPDFRVWWAKLGPVLAQVGQPLAPAPVPPPATEPAPPPAPEAPPATEPVGETPPQAGAGGPGKPCPNCTSTTGCACGAAEKAAAMADVVIRQQKLEEVAKEIAACADQKTLIGWWKRRGSKAPVDYRDDVKRLWKARATELGLGALQGGVE